MKKIRLLSAEIAQKIAAGEVIERPVSIVKELVENSLDAAAVEIRVDLQNGGKTLIRVQDNGSGMSREDASLCFRRHSTSKIFAEEDLERIATLGFRGEALASISAVSRLSLKTSDGNEGRGTQIEREGDKLRAITDIAFPRGTTVEVRDIFFNLPVRRKFLRSDRSELSLITKYMTVAALASPGVHFSLIHGTREILNCPAVQNLRERIYQIYGKTILEGLMDVDYEEGESRVRGLSSRPLKGRMDRNHQFFFVNSRPVKDRLLQASLSQVYSGILEKDKSAEVFLFLSVPFSDVDVNVHPAKAEVRFRDPQAVFRLVARSVEKAALRTDGIKEVSPVEAGTSEERPRPGVKEEGRAFEFGPGFGAIEKRTEGEAVFSLTAAAKPAGIAVLGQYRDMYIVAASGEGLLIIDQHNAHERVLYEKYLEVDRRKAWPRRMLLLPVLLEFSPSQVLSFEENHVLFEESGFLIEPMGGRSYALKEHPDVFKPDEARDVFLALLEDVGREKAAARREKLLATMACKTAVKAGDILPRAKMEYLVEELFKTSHPSLCPHGRPVVIKIEKSRIDKGLGRSAEGS